VKPPGNQAVVGGNMEVRLKQEWRGHHAGAIVTVSESCANILFQRDTAEKMEPESIEQIRKKLQNIVAENLLKSTPNK
jgi:hypothetical protein